MALFYSMFDSRTCSVSNWGKTNDFPRKKDCREGRRAQESCGTRTPRGGRAQPPQEGTRPHVFASVSGHPACQGHPFPQCFGLLTSSRPPSSRPLLFAQPAPGFRFSRPTRPESPPREQARARGGRSTTMLICRGREAPGAPVAPGERGGHG